MSYTFITNKYTRWYYQLINSRKIPQLSNRGYTELHHIIPKSLGGNNDKSNLVRLTAREHFIAHLLLVRMVQYTDTYRMIHAIIRFKSNVSNSKEFDLLRSTLHTYSKGKYNSSFGKIWAYMINTGEIIYILKDEFNPDHMIKGLPFQRGGFSNYRWINNGDNESLISKNDIMPNGWALGRINGGTLSHMKEMSRHRHTLEKDKQHSDKMKGENHFNYGKIGFTKGRFWINYQGKSKMITKNELQEYIDLGWKRGRH